MKVIETEYKDYLFRSRLEARWAVFFDACGIRWEYEPEGYVLNNGQHYLPDFLLHDVDGRVGGDLYVEVKGKMSRADAAKINQFSEGGGPYPFNFQTVDGDYFVAHPGINKQGKFELFGDDSNYTMDRDDAATVQAFKLARQARFEYGQTPRVRKVRV